MGSSLISRLGCSPTSWSDCGARLPGQRSWYGRVDDILTGTETMRPADLTNRKTHEAEHNSREIAEILTGLRAARSELVGRLDALDEPAIVASALHPRLHQPMRVIDLAFFVAEHDDHHLARVSRLKRTLGG